MRFPRLTISPKQLCHLPPPLYLGAYHHHHRVQYINNLMNAMCKDY